MPDNVPILDAASVSTPIASDDVSGVQFQKVKLDIGGDGVSVPVVGTTTIPFDTVSAPPVRQVPADLWRTSFADVGAGVPSSQLTLRQTGAGMTVNQSASNLVITTGTTTNAETVIRSDRTFNGAHILRYRLILSQRIVNQHFEIALADTVGEALSYTINSATSVTVTFPTTNPFSALSVGQSVNLGQITGAAGIPGRYAIASVSGLTVTFTVAAWPASGSGTLMLWGYSFHRIVYSGATATSANYDAQRRGWASGDTVATINTTATPGHVGHLHSIGHLAGYSDALVASNAAYQFTARASRLENLPDDQTPMHLFIIARNGSTAPASTTTLTIGFVSVEMTGRNKVYVTGGDQMGGPMASGVQVLNFPGTQTVAGTVTANIGTGALAAGANVIGSVNLSLPLLVADVPSAALTTTTTTAAFTPAHGTAFSVNIPVTVVTGTTPTLDVVIEESDDTGTNWLPVFAFPRITATGIYRSPMIPSLGNRVRYAQTVTGTTPSFTRAINRLQRSDSITAIRQIIDRTVTLTTLSSVTPVLTTIGSRNAQLVINVGAITTTAPALQLEGSDDNGLTWYAVGSPLTAVASSTVQVTVTGTQSQQLRARVSTAGVGVTAGYVLVKGF